MLGAGISSAFAREFSNEELTYFLDQIKEEIARRTEPAESTLYVPVEIFNTTLSPGESIVKYLKEQFALKFSEISAFIGRDERGIWTTYNRSQKKHPETFELPDYSFCLIPVNIFADRRYSLFESALLYLVDVKHYKISQLTTILGKAYPTLYTTYTRAKKKGGASDE